MFKYIRNCKVRRLQARILEKSAILEHGIDYFVMLSGALPHLRGSPGRKGHPLSAYRQARPTGLCTYLGMWSWTFLPSAVSANFVSPQAPRVSCRPPTFAIVLEQENGYRISTAIRYLRIRNWLDPSRKLVISLSDAGHCTLQ